MLADGNGKYLSSNNKGLLYKGSAKVTVEAETLLSHYCKLIRPSHSKLVYNSSLFPKKKYYNLYLIIQTMLM